MNKYKALEIALIEACGRHSDKMEMSELCFVSLKAMTFMTLCAAPGMEEVKEMLKLVMREAMKEYEQFKQEEGHENN